MSKLLYQATPISELPPISDNLITTINIRGYAGNYKRTDDMPDDEEFIKALERNEITHWLKPIDITSIIEEKVKEFTDEKIIEEGLKVFGHFELNMSNKEILQLWCAGFLAAINHLKPLP